jgi:hypothetical protein
MKNILNSKSSKTAVDVLMALTFILTVAFSKTKKHGFFGIALSLLIVLHIAQRWSVFLGLFRNLWRNKFK